MLWCCGRDRETSDKAQTSPPHDYVTPNIQRPGQEPHYDVIQLRDSHKDAVAEATHSYVDMR